MKKSTAFILAQLAVLAHTGPNGREKLDILRVLMESEDLAKYCEMNEKKECDNDVEAL